MECIITEYCNLCFYRFLYFIEKYNLRIILNFIDPAVFGLFTINHFHGCRRRVNNFHLIMSIKCANMDTNRAGGIFTFPAPIQAHQIHTCIPLHSHQFFTTFHHHFSSIIFFSIFHKNRNHFHHYILSSKIAIKHNHETYYRKHNRHIKILNNGAIHDPFFGNTDHDVLQPHKFSFTAIQNLSIIEEIYF